MHRSLGDRWRVVLKGEVEDYINAVVVNVSVKTVIVVCLHTQWCLYVGLQAAESLHHSSESHAVHCQRLLEDGL